MKDAHKKRVRADLSYEDVTCLKSELEVNHKKRKEIANTANIANIAIVKEEYVSGVWGFTPDPGYIFLFYTHNFS